MKHIDDIWEILGKDKQALNECLLESAHSPVDLSNQVSQYLIDSGGKRIRPLVLLLLARALGYKGNLHYQLATAVEFIHTATLLHDDVVDESSIRRNHPTANSRFGNAAAVLVGDFLYTRAFQLISQKLDAARIMADATNELAMGEVMQLMNINNLDLTEKDYYQVIYLKTAVLFSAACRFSAYLAKRQDIAQACGEYGKHLGQAFQIADDVLDYLGDREATGKNIGDDLAESKMTLPLIYARANAKTKDKKCLEAIIKQGNREGIKEVIEILNKTGAIDYTLKVAYEQADKAKASLSALPESCYKQALLALPDMAVKRSG